MTVLLLVLRLVDVCLRHDGFTAQQLQPLEDEITEVSSAAPLPKITLPTTPATQVRKIPVDVEHSVV